VTNTVDEALEAARTALRKLDEALIGARSGKDEAVRQAREAGDEALVSVWHYLLAVQQAEAERAFRLGFEDGLRDREQHGDDDSPYDPRD